MGSFFKNFYTTESYFLLNNFSKTLWCSLFLFSISQSAHSYEDETSLVKSIDPALGISSGFGRWNGSISLVYDPDGAPALFSDSDDVLDLIEAATTEWELVSGIKFNLIGADSNASVDEDISDPDEKDGLVRIHWGNTGGAAGFGGPGSSFHDSDLGYFPYIDGRVKLSDNSDTWDSQDELVNVLVHELGHVMGFGHSDNPDSVMYANPYNFLAHPRADDIRAARTMYGVGSLILDDVTQAISQFLYSPPPAAAASATENLFKSNQVFSQGSFVAVDSDSPLASVNASVADDNFVNFYFAAGPSSSDIEVDITVVYVDPFGYVYKERDYQISCDANFSCGSALSIAGGAVLKTIPGEWTVYVIDDATQTTLHEMSFLVDTENPINQPPVAEVTVSGVSNTMVNISLTVTDSDSGTIDVVWHPQNLGDEDNDGFLDTDITDSVQSGGTIARDFSFLTAETHTMYIELNDNEPRYDGSNAGSSSAGDGFQSLIAITVDLPVASDNDVSIVSTFADDFTNGNGDDTDGGTGNTDQVVNTIADANTLKLITTTDGSSSSAGFGAGASSNEGSTADTVFTDGDSIIIAGSVTPQAADVGEAGEILVVFLANEIPTFLDVNGLYQSWFGSIKTLEPAYEISSLSSVENFEVFSGDVQSGTYKVWLGYRLAAGGPLHFNLQAFKITVD